MRRGEGPDPGLLQKVEEAGGRAKLLAVSGGFHSPFMESASEELGAVLETVGLQEPRVPVYANFNAEPYTAESARELLVNQVKSPVRWQETVERLCGLGWTPSSSAARKNPVRAHPQNRQGRHRAERAGRGNPEGGGGGREGSGLTGKRGLPAGRELWQGPKDSAGDANP